MCDCGGGGYVWVCLCLLFYYDHHQSRKVVDEYFMRFDHFVHNNEHLSSHEAHDNSTVLQQQQQQAQMIGSSLCMDTIFFLFYSLFLDT